MVLSEAPESMIHGVEDVDTLCASQASDWMSGLDAVRPLI